MKCITCEAVEGSLICTNEAKQEWECLKHFDLVTIVGGKILTVRKRVNPNARVLKKSNR